jgi:hypothetical protein
LFPVAGIEARIERLSRIPQSGPPVGPLLPPADRKLARKKVRVQEEDSTEPLLPTEQQQRALELETPAPASLDSRPDEPVSASGWCAKM